MKSMIFPVATFVLAASAIPVERALTASIILSNDLNGAYGEVAVPIDGTGYQIYEHWKNTNANQGGKISVTSASLSGGWESYPECVFRNEQGFEMGRLYTKPSGDSRTWLKLGSNPASLDIVVMDRATITCYKQ